MSYPIMAYYMDLAIVKKMIHDDQVSIQIEKEDLAENTRFCQLNVDIKG